MLINLSILYSYLRLLSLIKKNTIDLQVRWTETNIMVHKHNTRRLSAPTLSAMLLSI